MKKLLIIILILFETICSQGQSLKVSTHYTNLIEISNDDLMKFRIYENIFSFCWLKKESYGVPCMPDFRKLKKDVIIDTLEEKFEVCSPKNLRIITDVILIDTLFKTITISGCIVDGLDKKESKIEIYIGQKADTLMPLIFPGTRKVLGYFHSLYLNDYSYFTSDEEHPKNKWNFNLTSKINENSILVFGLPLCYCEIFDIGKLLKEIRYKKTLLENEINK